MSLTTDHCFRCNEKRPTELRDKAIAFRMTDEGKSAASKKRARKALGKAWSPAEWAEYERIRQERWERGSVVSSHLNDYSTVASGVDVANLSDLREWQEESSATIPEEEQAQSTSQSCTGWNTGWSGWQDKWHGGYRKYRHVQNGAARATVALVG